MVAMLFFDAGAIYPLTEKYKALSKEYDMSAEQIAEMFKDTSLEDLKKMIRPSIEEGIKNNIATAVEKSMEQMPLDKKVAALTAQLATADEKTLARYYDEVTVFSNAANAKRYGIADKTGVMHDRTHNSAPELCIHLLIS